MLIYGLGAIGVEIARLARLLGLKIIGVRRSPARVEHVDEMHTPDQLGELAAALRLAHHRVPADR